MDASEEDDETEITSETTQEMDTEEPARRVTRSAAKKLVTFAVDDQATSELINKRAAKRQSQPQEAISPEGQRKLGLVASKRTIMKKLRKSKKKSTKHVSALSDLVDTLSM